MIKPVIITKLLVLLAVLPCFVFGQHLDHPLGEILIQLKSPANVESFQESIKSTYPDFHHKSNLAPVSIPLNVWIVKFDPNTFNERSILAFLTKNQHLQSAQFNYFTSNRNTPNDPHFSEQWYWYNAGQVDSPEGIDIEAHLAWDISTGGTTFLGDTVVLCIIDESFDFNHEDLFENLWLNHQEIPNDGIDNDDNGYIDDYQGWNASSGNDDINTTGVNDWHGTAVAGLSGAKGNNETGISGLCWNTKLMLVSRGNTTADAVAAYTYPLVSRRLHNQTNGQQGAYIVATNASWGIDFGTPDDAPIWCSIYDSLGQAGILNAAATTNMNLDVDQYGDLPTTCISDYLITTTTVDQYDIKMENSGFGAQSIDLATFGDELLTTLGNNTYGTISGTSAAAPQLTGAIGLLHSAPCPSFASTAKYEPEVAALQLKEYILNGVEYNPSLSGITLSGGRLNVNNSMMLLMDNCDYSGCYPPFSIEVNEVGVNDVQVCWISDNPDNQISIEYRLAGAGFWSFIENIESPFHLTGLQACDEYEFRLISVCQGNITVFSDIHSFSSDGCCSAPDEFEFSATNATINISWNAITAAEAYLLEFRVMGSSSWNEQLLVGNNFAVPNLEECTEYEFRVKTICANEESAYSEIMNYYTLGCDACVENDYCFSAGASGGLTWIDQVIIGNLDNSSGVTSNAYSNFTNMSVELTQGFIHEIYISTDFDILHVEGIFSVWIDLNQNGIFEGLELLYQSNSSETETSAALFIPPGTPFGASRMRVAFQQDYLGPCDEGSFIGEVEDYCVFISEPTECLPPVNIGAEISNNSAQISWSGNLLIDEYIFNYKETGTTEWQSSILSSSNLIIYDLEPCVAYEYYVISVCDGETSQASPLLSFTTKGCGTCLDEDYCEVIPGNISFEWIESVHFNDLLNVSGPNNGYKHFTGYTTTVHPDSSYSITLKPGFSNELFTEIFYVWIDLNQDGVYNDVTEKFIESVSIDGAAIDQTITIPGNVSEGVTRMKIAMKYVDPIYNPCEGGFFGEIEEYCINIYDVGTPECQEAFIDYTETIDSQSVIVSWNEIQDAVSYRLRYRAKDSTHLAWQIITTANTNATLSNLIHCELYDLQIQTICGSGMGSFGEVNEISACLLVHTAELSEQQYDISIFPNPFSNRLSVLLNADKNQMIDLEIYSGIGQLVDRTQFEAIAGNNQFDYHLRDISDGVYFLKLSVDNKLLDVRKIIRQAP